MADNMIERVARAIDPIPFGRLNATDSYPAERRRVDARIQQARNSARTALKAMREIDGKMWSAGTKEFLDRYRCCEQQTTTEMFHAYADKSAEAILDAMIDAALNEGGNE